MEKKLTIICASVLFLSMQIGRTDGTSSSGACVLDTAVPNGQQISCTPGQNNAAHSGTDADVNVSNFCGKLLGSATDCSTVTKPKSE